MSNEKIRELYEEEAGHSFQRTELEPMQPLPLGATLQLIGWALLPLFICATVAFFWMR